MLPRHRDGVGSILRASVALAALLLLAACGASRGPSPSGSAAARSGPWSCVPYARALPPPPRLPQGHLAVVSRLVSAREVRVDHANWASGAAKGQVARDQPV